MKSPKCVLVVEDDESTRELLELALSDQGYSVIAAVDGATALHLVGDLRPDLILLDIRMPVMDGEAFFDAYSKLPGPHAPIVVLSATSAFFDSRLFDSKGAVIANAFLKKPFDLNELYFCIKHYAGEP